MTILKRLCFLMAITLFLIVFSSRSLIVNIYQQKGFIPTSQNAALAVFKSRTVVIWTNDLHIGPIEDVKTFLEPMGVRFIDKNLDHTRCDLTQACAGMKSMRVINPHNAL